MEDIKLKKMWNAFNQNIDEAKILIRQSWDRGTAIRGHCEHNGEGMGYKVSAPEALINYFGYDALHKKYYSKAEALFKLNIKSYPGSTNVHDSYTDYFIVKKDTINAIANYKKALQIKNDVTTLRKLNSLAKQKSFNLNFKNLQKYVGVDTLGIYKVKLLLKSGGQFMV